MGYLLLFIFTGLKWSAWFLHFAYIPALLLMSYFFFLYRTRFLRRANRELRQRDMLAKDLQRQKHILVRRNKEIEDSLNYAQQIQRSMFISEKQLRELLPESFIIHKSKDIVSGDFYWISRINEKIFIAAVDCTGHGVPGAFLSLIGFELLRKIINTQGIHEPDAILEALNNNLHEIFGNGEETYLRDGMDLSLCVLNTTGNCLYFSGAFSPLYIVRNNAIMEVKGDHIPIGADFPGQKVNSHFTSHRILIEPDDMIYLFSDGYADQFGGPEGKKFKYRRFRHLLLTIHNYTPDKQKQYLEESLREWKGNLEQIDDILIIGFRHNPPASGLMNNEIREAMTREQTVISSQEGSSSSE